MKNPPVWFVALAVFLPLRSGLKTDYERWLNEDVVYIITDYERQEFRRLRTDEEREQFIEVFWGRRDPTPHTIENEFEEEHYRRLAYANERYGYDVPGWKSDRGGICVLFGPPDQVESASSHRTERWRYRYLKGLGKDVIFEFADSAGQGDYRITRYPAKEARLVVQTGGAPPRVAAKPLPPDMAEFEHLEHFANPKPPANYKILKILEAALSSHITSNALPFKVEVDFIKVTSRTALANITIQFDNIAPDAAVYLYGRVGGASLGLVRSFQQTVRAKDSSAMYPTQIPLVPGAYHLDIAALDAAGDINSFATDLMVPRFEDEKLASSSLILADILEKLPKPGAATSEFVIGSSMIRPRLSGVFRQDEKLGIYMQIYNFGADEGTNKPDGTIHYEVFRDGGGEKVFDFTEDASKIANASPQQVTMQKQLPLRSLQPGKYSIKIKVTDQNRNQTLNRHAAFTVE